MRNSLFVEVGLGGLDAQFSGLTGEVTNIARFRIVVAENLELAKGYAHTT